MNVGVYYSENIHFYNGVCEYRYVVCFYKYIFFYIYIFFEVIIIDRNSILQDTEI